MICSRVHFSARFGFNLLSDAIKAAYLCLQLRRQVYEQEFNTAAPLMCRLWLQMMSKSARWKHLYLFSDEKPQNHKTENHIFDVVNMFVLGFRYNNTPHN